MGGPRTTAVLLAAGAGTRLGRGPKALLPFRGRPLVEHQIRVLRAGGCRDVLVVLGAGSDRILAEADLTGARVVLNPDWQRGMGTSYRQGMAAAVQLRPAAVLVALVDQPGLTAAAVSLLRSSWVPGRIASAGYRDADGRLRRGHPVLFDVSLAARSLEPGGMGGVTAATDAAAVGNPDAGARSFLASRRELVDITDCSRLADGRDVDTESDMSLLD